MDISGIAAPRIVVPNAQVAQTRAEPAHTSAAAAPVVADNATDVTSTKDARNAQPSDSESRRAVETLNKFLASTNNAIEFSLDQDTGQTLVKIVDTDTQVVIRQIPTEQAVEISKDLSKLQGLLVKAKA